MAPPKKTSDENLQNVPIEKLFEELSGRVREHKLSPTEYERLVDLFNQTFMKSTGLKIPPTPRATTSKTTGVSFPFFIWELGTKLKSENKLSDVSSLIIKILGIQYMLNYPEEWKQLADTYESGGEKFKIEKEF